VKVFTAPVCSVPTAAGSVSGVNLEATGKWTDGEWKYTTLTITSAAGGLVGAALFSWSWSEGGLSGSGTTRSTYQPVVNGLRLRWPSGATLQAGDAWTVRVSLPQSYRSGPWANGQHAFRIDTISALGVTTTGSVLNATMVAPPTAPTLVSNVFATGTLTIVWRTPNEAGVYGYRIRRNRLYGGEEAVYELPVASAALAANTTFQLVDSSLEEGTHRFSAVTVNEDGIESAETSYEITIDSGGASATAPNPPFSITADVNASGNLAIVVHADDTGDTINLYTNSGSGAVSYASTAGTIVNPQTSPNKRLEGTLAAGSDGVWLVAARHELDGFERFERGGEARKFRPRLLPPMLRSVNHFRLEIVRLPRQKRDDGSLVKFLFRCAFCHYPAVNSWVFESPEAGSSSPTTSVQEIPSSSRE